MTSVEKRRSGRKSGKHRKHSDGGYSDTSSAGSFLDETDREVSNLTDRAFRSLCIGDEAVYNDSDLGASSPCTQRDRQLAFSHIGQDGSREDRQREELKRAAHESFSLRMQQYGQEWMHGGMYGAEIQRDPQWGVYGERTQGRVSATFQHSFVETSQQEEAVREEQLSFLSNGAAELNTQQRRSRSRVSSLIKAFNAEGYRDGAGMDGNLREWEDGTSWDKSALMSIQRELSEFSTSYQENFNSGHFPTAGQFSSQNTNFYSSEVAAHMNSGSSFMRSSHRKHSMSAQVNCNSNFFIHSEFSPFKVWRDHNRFPFQQGQVSGFMQYPEFPKWYETPMYRELSLEPQPQGPYRFDERLMRYPRNNMAPVVPHAPPRSTSTSTMMQKSLAVEKRCESELAGHYPHRKRTQSLGANRLPVQRPSTASPTVEMSRRVQDTISSVKALQQKIKMMTEQNMTMGISANQQLYSNNFIPYGNNANTESQTVISNNSSTTPYGHRKLPTPLVNAYQEAETPEVWQQPASPQLVEHAPVRAESRGATPDIRKSGYRSRASSLLFNLKDNRKRVKSTYSPTKFKGMETQETNKQVPVQGPRDTVIDIPDFPDVDTQYPYGEDLSRTNAAAHQYTNQYPSQGMLAVMQNSQPPAAYVGQYSDYTSSDYQTAQIQGGMVQHAGFTDYIPENYSSNQLANGQNPYEDSPLYKQNMMDSVETPGGNVYRFHPSSTATGTPRLNTDNNQSRDYLISKANTEQHFNQTAGREFTKVDRYHQLGDDYTNVSSQDEWGQTNSRDAKHLSPKAEAVSPWKQETAASTEEDQYTQAYQRAAAVNEEMNVQNDTYSGHNLQSRNKQIEETELRESYGVASSPHRQTGLLNPNITNQQPQFAPFYDSTVDNSAYHGQQQSEVLMDKEAPQNIHDHNQEYEMKGNYLTPQYDRYTHQEYRNQHAFYSSTDNPMLVQETGQRKQHTPIPKGHEVQSQVQPVEAKAQFRQNVQKNASPNPDNASALTMEKGKDIEPQHAQAELAKAQQLARAEQSRAESAGLILAGQTGSEKVREEPAKAEPTGSERVIQDESEHISEEKRQVEGGEEAEDQQSTAKKKTEEAQREITDETGAEHMAEEQGEQVKAERAEAETLKEDHIKTEPAETEQAGGGEQHTAASERIKAEKLEEEQVKAEEVKREQMEAEQIRAEKVKAEQAEEEHRRAQQSKLEQETKAELEKTKVVEGNLILLGQVREQPSTQMRKVIEEKVEESKAQHVYYDHAKVELAKAELAKRHGLQERSAKPAAKLTQQVKGEPDRVQQVKSELAKAKAELAKIKQKMRGDQKEKVRITALPKENENKKEVDVNINDQVQKDQDKETQTHHQKKESDVTWQSTDQAKADDDFKLLKEKYGFTETSSTNRNKLSPVINVSSPDTHDTPALTLDKVETINNETSKGKNSQMSESEVVDTFKSNEVKESHYVYCESSKQFKLSDANYLPSDAVKRGSGDTVPDNLKDKSVEKLEQRDPVKQTDATKQRESDSAKSLHHERKPKSTDHSLGSGKDQHPPRALSHKDRAQTKQEILTEKIKAHAEKEISAIKEKGFALRDGILSKSYAKQLVGNQVINIRQKPPSQEVPKKQESTVSSHVTPKKQIEPVKSDSPPPTATIPVKSAATMSHLEEHSQKQVPKESMSSNDSRPQPLKETTQTGSQPTTTDNSKNQTYENISGFKTLMQIKEQIPNKEQEKQEANKGEISEIRRKDHPAGDPNKKTDDPSQVTALVEVGSSTPVKKEKAESENGAVHQDIPLKLVFGGNETAAAGDDLQITGIMVTVRERRPSVNDGQRETSTEELLNAKEKECSHYEGDRVHPSSDLNVSKDKKLAQEKVQNINPTVEESQTKVGKIMNSSNMQETSKEIRPYNASERVTVKRTEPQRETQPQEPLVKKYVPTTVTVPAKNSALAETQPPLRDIIVRETKDNTSRTLRVNPAKSTSRDEDKSNIEEENVKVHTLENVAVKMGNTGINKTNVSNGETVIKVDTEPSVKKDITTLVNPSKNSNTGVKSAPPLEERRHDATSPRLLNKNSPSKHLSGNEIPVENEVVDDVHIDSIAIRVVPAVSVNAGPSDVVTASDHKQVTSSDNEEKVRTLHNEERSKKITPANSEKQMKDSSEDKSAVQSVLESVKQLSKSLKDNSQQISSIATNVRSQAENGQPELVNVSGKSDEESKPQPMEGDYFQVQGVAETNSEPQGAVSKERGLPGLQANKAAISNESSKEEKNEVFVLDQRLRRQAELNLVSIEEENNKKSNVPTGRQSNANTTEKREVVQPHHVRKQHKEEQSSSSTRDRQASRNSHPMRENPAQEKPEAKPKPKDRVSTIPEISALADYARLKVIVSEDQDTPIQEFPPSKKEGFFPLIQSRHSRRPVFNTEPQDLTVREKSLPTKTEASSKVNKDPKPLVFPITDKEHQRTGMFKLGDKERQEKSLLDSKTSDGVSDTRAQHGQDVKERDRSLTHMNKKASEEQVAGRDMNQTNNPPMQATTSSSTVKTSLSQDLKPQRSSSPHERLKKFSSKAERITSLDKDSHPQASAGRVHRTEEITRTVTNDAKNEKVLLTSGKEKTDKLGQERPATQHQETKARQQNRAQVDNEHISKREEEKIAENLKIKQMLQESRASLAEEERRAAQREEMRRAKEREAIAAKIRERRERQKEAERKAEEESKTKQTEAKKSAEKEAEVRANKIEERGIKEIEEKRRIKIEDDRRAKLKKEDEWLKEYEERKRVKLQEEKQRRAAQEEREKRAVQEEQRKRERELQQRKLLQEEQQRRVAQEQQRRAEEEEKEKRAAQEEQQRRGAQEEQQRRAAQEEQQRRAAREQQQRRAALEEQKRKAEQEEQQRKAVLEEQQIRAAREEQEKRAALEEQQRIAVQQEQQRRAALEEQQRRAALEEQQRRDALEEQQRRAALEEQQRRAALEEQQRRDALEEQQRRDALEEQQRRAAQEEQQRKAEQEEQQRRAALEEQQRSAVQQEKQVRAAREEQQRRAALEEQQHRAAREEQKRKAEQEEQQMRAALEEQQRRAALEEQQRRVAQEKQQRRAALEEQERKAALEEQQRRAAQEEQERKAAIEEQQRRAAQEEMQRQAAQEEQQRKAAQEKQQRRAVQEQQWMKAALIEENRIREQEIENQREQERRTLEKEQTIIRQREEKQAKEERTRLLMERQAALKEEEKRVAQEQMQAQREEEALAKKREEEEKLAASREKEQAAQKMGALQYYAITSAEPERKPKEKHVQSHSPPQQRPNPESPEESRPHSRIYRPHAPASPAPALPRSNTSSPALGVKPSMFRVKDNTMRASTFKSVKPRFHKNFGEDFRVGSPMEKGPERGEEEQEILRRGAGTPVYTDTGFNKPQYRPYSRRSIALDEDDSRSVISNMSEDVESFATSGTDLADVRGLYDYDRPESACSFSSDVSRLSKPPVVPPKSEKALRRAKRLTTRRIKKELSKADAPDNPSSSTEVRPPSRHATASPHFSSPVSLAIAPTSGSSLPSTNTEHQSSPHASPHATAPVSLAVASPHATAPVSLPVAPPHAAGPASHPAAPKTVPHVPSSPTLHHANHPAPVTQYHVESGYPQSYPLTQRKVLQDLGSGQYFVVDVPVQVKTKTFIDPQTGKYVQLNVRESSQGATRPQPQQTYLQPQLQARMQVKPQKQPLPKASPAGKPVMLYEGYPGYPQGYQPTAINPVSGHRSSAPVTHHQDQQPDRQGRVYGYPAPETGQSSEGHRYSPEKTPYMDTVNDTDKTHNAVYNTHGPYEALPECDTNSQLAGNSACENEDSAPSQYQSRDIITMGELEDFMEVSDW